MRRYRSSCRPALLSKNHFSPLLHQRYGERPVLVAHQKKCASAGLRVHRDAFLFACLGGEISGVLPVLSEFTAEYNVAPRRGRRFPSAQPRRTFRPRATSASAACCGVSKSLLPGCEAGAMVQNRFRARDACGRGRYRPRKHIRTLTRTERRHARETGIRSDDFISMLL